MDHPEFLDLVYQVCSQTEALFHSCSALHRFYRKIKLLKPVLRYGNITHRTREAFDVLCDKQNQTLVSPPDSHSFSEI